VYEVSVEGRFSAAHRLRGYRGDCERLHGHNYRVRAAVSVPDLGPDGLALDFRDLKAAMREVLAELDHRHLNADVPEFAEGRLNPSAENLARFIFERLAGRELPNRARPVRITVWESPGCSVTYRGPRGTGAAAGGG
jgi:6-pyruvoyltetrahydropterin/6-carboxytetrahydropterin synthase